MISSPAGGWRCTGALRRGLAAQDQRHQRLCRLDRLVELLLAPDAQPSRPRRLAGVQRRHRAAADGARRLHGARADPGALFRSSPSPGSARWSPISSINKPLGAEPALHRVQARPSLRHQSGGRGRDAAGAAWRSAAGLYRRLRRHGAGAVAVRRARRGLRRRAAHRLRHRRPLLHRAQAAAQLGRRDGRALQHLREPVRARGHGLLPGLWRADLLALLLARFALPRPLQAPRPAVLPARGAARRAGARAARGADRFPPRPLPRPVAAAGLGDRHDARRHLSADRAELGLCRAPSCARRSGRSSSCC